MAAVARRRYQPRGGYQISVRWTPEAALAYMDRQQIAAPIVSMPMTFAGSADQPEFGTRLSRMINEGNAELIAKHPDRFGAFATLPGDGPDEALAELGHALDELRLDGVVLTSNVLGRYFGDPSLEPVLAELDRREVPVRAPDRLPTHRRPGLRPPELDRRVPVRYRAHHHQRPLHRCLPMASAAAPDPRPLRRCAAHPRLADRRTHRHGTRTGRRGH